MPRKPTGEPNGRPNYEIDWNKVDDLLMAGCTGTEIASYLGIHPDTLYHRTEEEMGVGFSEYLRKKRAKGDTILHAAQYDEAVRKRKIPMLIWLGKNRLNQTDKKEVSHEGTINFKVVHYGDKKVLPYKEQMNIESNNIVEIEAKVEKLVEKEKEKEKEEKTKTGE